MGGTTGPTGPGLTSEEVLPGGPDVTLPDTLPAVAPAVAVALPLVDVVMLMPPGPAVAEELAEEPGAGLEPGALGGSSGGKSSSGGRSSSAGGSSAVGQDKKGFTNIV
jgi:hypothetical protein